MITTGRIPPIVNRVIRPMWVSELHVTALGLRDHREPGWSSCNWAPAGLQS